MLDISSPHCKFHTHSLAMRLKTLQNTIKCTLAPLPSLYTAYFSAHHSLEKMYYQPLLASGENSPNIATKKPLKRTRSKVSDEVSEQNEVAIFDWYSTNNEKTMLKKTKSAEDAKKELIESIVEHLTINNNVVKPEVKKAKTNPFQKIKRKLSRSFSNPQ